MSKPISRSTLDAIQASLPLLSRRGGEGVLSAAQAGRLADDDDLANFPLSAGAVADPFLVSPADGSGGPWTHPEGNGRGEQAVADEIAAGNGENANNIKIVPPHPREREQEVGCGGSEDGGCHLPGALAGWLNEGIVPDPEGLARKIVQLSHELANGSDGGSYPLGDSLAAGFDLLVATRFYGGAGGVSSRGWLSCSASGQALFVFSNACPSCLLDRKLAEPFVYVEGNKPSSGQIGPVTSTAFREILCEYFAENKAATVVHKGKEPVDVGFVDAPSLTVLLGEIKSGPLFIPPLSVRLDLSTFQKVGTAPIVGGHQVGNLKSVQSLPVSLFVPEPDSDGCWLWDLGSVDASLAGWAERAVLACLKDPFEGLKRYRTWVRSWKALWIAYQLQDKEGRRFWLTGACGRPKEVGSGWPRDDKGKPEKTISDSKTSVGMDRTDDIKKSVFQVLNIGLEASTVEQPWTILVGLLSNLHAARHHDDYLKPYEDIVWGHRGDAVSPDVTESPDPESADLRNLFDGIVSFTGIVANHEWVGKAFPWALPISRTTADLASGQPSAAGQGSSSSASSEDGGAS